MKNLFSKLCRQSLSAAFVAVLFIGLSSPAQLFISKGNFSGGNNPLAFCGAGVTNGFSPAIVFQSNVVWFCASARNTGVPRLFNFSAIGDLVAATGGGLQTYFCTNVTAITNAGISGTNALLMDMTGFASNDVIVLQSVANDAYQRLIITNATGPVTGGSAQTWPSAGFATAVGDLVYKMTPSAILNIPLSFTNWGTASPLIYGQAGKPLLVDMNFSNSASLKLVSGDWFPLSYPFSR